MTSELNNDPDSLKSDSSRPGWGLLPQDVLQALKNKHWQNSRKLKSLLSGGVSFPLVVPLKPPRGNAAIQNIGHFQNFVSSWKAFSQADFQESGQGTGQERSRLYGKGEESKNTGCEVVWEKRNFRSLAEQDVPTHLKILDIGSLACILGPNEERQLQNWLSKIRYIFEQLSPQSFSLQREGHQASSYEGSSSHDSFHKNSDQNLFQALIDHLETLDNFDKDDLELLVRLLPQLQKGMGEGGYLRALPVTFVDTKFIEKNSRIIESAATALIDKSVKDTGLISWLDCKEKPKDWLLVKPLCEKTKALLGGLPLLRLSSDTLQEFELPARNILVVENEQSCLALRDVRNTIAVSGGGKNISWMKAGWLADKNVGYWGDIDSEGMAILSDARSKLSSITPLMMDEQTVKTFADRMVSGPDSVAKTPVALTDKELILFNGLRADHYANKRLEQERIPVDYVLESLRLWLG
ncbi:Wadjet anti-phage system protein JetD domain-containing protein [Alkalimarinus coralli]|uniref:Wadjet anti-phage system protein JetD domain-containing protein n=1 Tax=Alkalimarinus coralli TaxID=2935863 RepID=UPI00202AE864|nr:Wadjet anti-phage system protein JetD domain-containing protein [Alkalimarinus coralli]